MINFCFCDGVAVGVLIMGSLQVVSMYCDHKIRQSFCKAAGVSARTSWEGILLRVFAMRDKATKPQRQKARPTMTNERFAEFPRQPNQAGGWTIEYAFLKAVNAQVDDSSIPMEDIERVLLAGEREVNDVD